jgi:hypothetical protein
MTPLCIIQGQTVLKTGTALFWWGGMQIDGDGTGGNAQGDPDFQAQTTLTHADGSYLDSETEAFGVVPRQIIEGVSGIVMGCQGFAINASTGMMSQFVVGDEGPSNKLSEGSIALANALGVPSSPTTGGTDAQDILWMIWPGKPATVNGKSYALQAA